MIYNRYNRIIDIIVWPAHARLRYIHYIHVYRACIFNYESKSRNVLYPLFQPLSTSSSLFFFPYFSFERVSEVFSDKEEESSLRHSFDANSDKSSDGTRRSNEREIFDPSDFSSNTKRKN